MIKFADDYDSSSFNKYNLIFEELGNLQSMLTNEEFAEVDRLVDDAERVRLIAKHLNDRRTLPIKYEALVRFYSGFDSIHIYQDEILY